jgi:HAE1 family hydrophobic/amphiphilic exporter-1
MAIWLGVIVAYMILASQFNSFIHPLLVLLAMPFCVVGAVLAMFWAGTSLNMYSMIGIVLLMGIVKKNSILLVEFSNLLRERGGREARLGLGWRRWLSAVTFLDRASLDELRRQRLRRRRVVRLALLRACPIRLRPILMTSVSTIAAAVPPALSLGPGAETVRSMAIVVIGGVAVSTLLTLFVVPCAYLIAPGRVRHAEAGEPETAREPVREAKATA